MIDNKIKVFVIEDSAVTRYLLTEVLSDAGDIEVIGTAEGPTTALSLLEGIRPDVITLDIMPRQIDGLRFLQRLLSARPMPVVVISVLTQPGSEAAMKALELGAVDYVPMQTRGPWNGILAQADEIVRKIRAASKTGVKTLKTFPAAKYQDGSQS
jgi:two-component system chemotaxis response regulator CheB